MGDAPLTEKDGAALLRADAALLGLLWLATLIGWSTLPDPMPAHFDAAGRPDRWIARDAGGFLLWILLPVVTTGLSLVMRMIRRLGVRRPDVWNVPRKPQFLALPAAQRAPVVAMLARFLALITLATTLLLALTQASFWLNARHPGRYGTLTLVLILALAGGIIVLSIVSYRRLDRVIADVATPR